MTVVATWAGEVLVRFDPALGLPLTLSGSATRDASAVTLLSFDCPQDPHLPALLQGAEVFTPDATGAPFVLVSAGRRYPIAARRIFVHQDLGARISQLLPPQPIRLRTRLIWALGMRLASFGPTRSWLLRRRSADPS